MVVFHGELPRQNHRNKSKFNIAQVTRWYLSHLSRWRSWRVHLVIIHFVGNSQPKGTKNAAEKDGRAQMAVSPNGNSNHCSTNYCNFQDQTCCKFQGFLKANHVDSRVTSCGGCLAFFCHAWPSWRSSWKTTSSCSLVIACHQGSQKYHSEWMSLNQYLDVPGN